MSENQFSAVTVAGARITAQREIRTSAERVLGRLWIDRVPSRLGDGDPSLWGLPADAPHCLPAQPGAARELLPETAELTGRLRSAGITDVAVIGSDAAAHAAAVIARNAGGGTLTVLDGLEPGPVSRLIDDPGRLRRTSVVLAEEGPVADTLMRVLHRAFTDAGLDEDQIAARCVVIADADSAAAKAAREAGRALIVCGPHPAFGALSPAALVPASLAGADVGGLLDQADELLALLGRPERNPGLVLGAILGGCARAGRDTLVIGQYACPLPGLGDWVGRMVSAATEGAVLPVVQTGGLPLLPADDMVLVSLGGRPHQDDVTVSGPLAVQLMIWEYATAVAAHLLGADPFGRSGRGISEAVLEPAIGQTTELATGQTTGSAIDQAIETTMDATLEPATEPAVPPAGPLPTETSAEGVVPSEATGAGMSAPAPGTAVQVPPDEAGSGFSTPAEVLHRLITILPADGHLTLLAYLDPDEATGQSVQVHRLAASLAARCGRPVTVDWGFVNHSREKGVYLVLTGNVSRDTPVPDTGRSLASMRLAQALATVRALREHGRPVARLNLIDRGIGMDELLEAAQGGA